MSLIEPGYLFSQHSLRTYQRCPRRFRLKYIDRQAWPAPEAEDADAYRQHLEAGLVFHQWIARALLGIPTVGHDTTLHPDLAAWWEAWQQADLSALPVGRREVELPLVVPLGAYRLYARFDLLALGATGEAVIVDWKTLAHEPDSAALRRSLQTRVYQYALVAAGHVITGGAPLDPEQVQMRYWFANTGSWVVLPYSRAAHQQNGRELLALAERIAAATREDLVRTDDAWQCATCGYRTLCEREVPSAEVAGRAEAGWLAEDLDYARDLSFSLDDVPAIEF
ncbi:MAG: PD-(D/E)XK nuclease family protein [Anaerolineales bacterium]